MLNDRQKAFCHEYLIDLNATQAAIRAGYSEKTSGATGHENLKKPEIQVYLQKLMDKRSEKTEITAEYVLNNIKSIGERCMQAEAILTDGVPTGEYKFDASNALKAQELMGKHLVLFSDKINHQNLDKDGKPADAVTKIEVVHVKPKD
jgi:phage terminase small subunit